MRIIDLTAGQRAIWFNKEHPDALYVDRRPEVYPDILGDSTNLQGFGEGCFDLIVFDPPHMNCGKNSDMSKRYGHHTTQQIFDLVDGVGKEAHRLARPDGLMAFKWNNHDIKLDKILRFMPQWEPLFGHLTKDGPGSQTYWVMLKKRPTAPDHPPDEPENTA